MSTPQGAETHAAGRRAEHQNGTGSARGTPLGLIARSAPLVVLGELVPMAAAVVAMPLLAARLGVDRLGVLSLAWVVIGYFSLFDLGVGRATTKLVAARIAAGRSADVPRLVATSLALLFVLGCAGGAILAVLAPWLVDRALQIPTGLQQESRHAFYVLAVTVPLVVLSSGLRGVLEAERRFATLSLLRVALGLISFLGPLLVLPFSESLVAVVLMLAAGRVVLFLATLASCRHVLVASRPAGGADEGVVGELLHFGGWLTVSNVVSPMLVLLDRFVVGSIVSVGAVAYYATPLEVVQRAGVVPIAIATVVFPAMAATALADGREARALLSTALRLSLAGIFPILFLLVLWAHEGLDLWLGQAFARESTTVVRWVALGLLLNALGCAALFGLQASGRPDLPAKLHVVELAGYVPLLWWLAERRGVEGAAIAWTARVGLDAVLLLGAAVIRFALTPRSVLSLGAATCLGLACLVLGASLEATPVKLIATLAVPAGYLAVCFTILFTTDERTAARDLFRRLG